jgi:hypothetical protein
MTPRNPIAICAKPQFWLLNKETINDALDHGGNCPVGEEVQRLKAAFVAELMARYETAPLSVGEFLKIHPESCCPIEAIALQKAVAMMQAPPPPPQNFSAQRPL